MKKVLIFSLNYYPRFIGGAEVAVKEITDRISPEEIEFHMVTLRFDSTLPKEERIGNVVVHRIGFATHNPSISDLGKVPLKLNKYWYQLRAAGVAHDLHQRHHFDGAWAMMAHSCAVPAGIFVSRHPNVKYLLTLQEGDPPEYIERLMRPVWPLFKNGFSKATELQAISSFLLAWGKRMGFGGEGRVIPNGVDVERFSHVFSEEEKRTTREQLGKTESEVYLVTTSRLVHKNGLDTVIRALPLLPSPVSFLIYGIGPDEEKLRSLAKELGVTSRVRFMGQIDHKDMPLMLSACDIFIRPSRSEGMGNSFIEAMVTGLPVIATQVGGISDFLFDRVRNPEQKTTGWAVDVEAPEQIAACVEDILGNPEATNVVLSYARETVGQRYDWSSVTEEMKDVFDRLLQG